MTVRANALGSRYELVSQLGAGAMGTVWRARDLSTDEAVAAKILHDHFASDVGIVTRFLQERTFLLQLDHPNIVRVRDLVVEGSQLGIVMDLVEGSDVRGLLRTTPTLPPARAAGIVADVLDGLAHAHALSVLHRDVKPDNVLLDGDTARLSDFSIARLAQETTVRMTGVLGTADYMAPEVFDEQVLPTFYDRDEQGVPAAWLARMRASLKTLGPRFSATRMLSEYLSGPYRGT